MKPTAPRPKGPLLLAVSLGAVTTFSLFLYLRQLETAKIPEESVPIVVAIKKINAESTLAATDVTLEVIPKRLVPANALHKTSDVVGRVNRFDLFPRDPLMDGKLYPAGSSGGLSFTIPPGKRAVAVAVDEVIGVAGFIKPGSRVDVIGAMEQEGRKSAKVVLQNIQVLAVAQEREDADTRKAKLVTSVTMAVSPTESEVLTLASEKGKIRLALRSASDKATIQTQGVHWQSPAKPTTPTQAVRPPSRAEAPRPPKPVAAPVRRDGIEVIRGTERETAGG